MLSLILLFVILCLALFYCIWTSTYWVRRGVEGPCGIPIFGNMYDFLIRKKAFGHVYEDIYKSYPDASYVGFYRILNEPAILVRDLDLVKEILIKSFSHFHDNVLWIDSNRDPLIASNPFAAKGDNWKAFRAQILPVFTPSKVKQSYPHINEACLKLESYIEQNFDNTSFETKDLCSKYTLEVVASAAYGLEAQAYTNENSDFTQLVEDLFQPHKFSLLETIALLFLPSLGHLIKYQYVPNRIQNWLFSIIGQVMMQRRRRPQSNHNQDFLQWVLETKDMNGRLLDDLVVVGHCTTFLVEGFETSGTLMAFALYEFAINADVQRKLQLEVDAVISKYNGKLSYEALQEMTYLECAMLETLRLHPAMYALLKQCTQRYKLPHQYKKPSTKEIFIEPGTTVVIPVNAIHYDPEIYPDPLKFQPERFSEENQRKRENCAYLAFGQGPRMCLGMRFGLAQSKAALATILSKYNIKLSRKMKMPLEISPTTFLLASRSGIWVNFMKREM